MKYISSRGHNQSTNFTNTMMMGLAPDGGLFMPQSFPQIGDISPNDTYNDIAFKVMSPFIGDTIPTNDLKNIINKCAPNPTPLCPIGNNTYLLELFHGETLAFKDIALNFLGHLFDYQLNKTGSKINIIGATSGDTGSAAIAAMRGRKNISVTILHPHNRTSEIQRKQMTTVTDDNVHNIAIEGTFDDCQNLVKQCFNDGKLRDGKNLSTINSINWARIIAQIVYYIFATNQLKSTCNFAVPTGNFGNILAAFIGKQMGGNIGQLIIGSNRNDIITRFFESGTMRIDTVIPSYSPSMDIQISSNFERYLYCLLGGDHTKLNQLMHEFKTTGQYSLNDNLMAHARNDFTAIRCSDIDTINTIRELYYDTGIVIDPHTAVGLFAMKNSGITSDKPNVVTACAHPAKFPDTIVKAIGVKPELPPHLSGIMIRPEKYQIMANDFNCLKKYIEKLT